uniref:Uncharacterized protein n=1 Tax=Panagrolaimus sp. JU765 TaxID=591449 RepID=A0AC34RIC4_9BILA
MSDREGNDVQQCPCVIPPNSNRCIAYDSRYSAVSVEEAILTFLDLTVDDFNGHSLDNKDYNCSTIECQECAALIFYRLKEVGFISPDYQPQFSFTLPAVANLHTFLCRRYWITRRRTLRGPPTRTPEYVQQLINAGQKYVPYYDRFPTSEYLQQVLQSLTNQQGPNYQTTFDAQEILIQQPNVIQTLQAIGEIPAPEAASAAAAAAAGAAVEGITLPPSFTTTSQPGHPGSSGDPLADLIYAKLLFLQTVINNLNVILQGKKRKKRSTPNVNDRDHIIGNRFVISCVEKGDAESDDTDFLNLCTACWTWRKLPDDYFPQILNELVCQENDFCLSGFDFQ